MEPTNKLKAVFNWSGGKDSSLGLYKILESSEYEISYLLTSLSEKYNRISQHGVRVELLDQQASSIGIALHKLILPEWSTMDDYNSLMKNTLTGFKKQKITITIFGDIFLEDLRKYREAQLAEASFVGVFPLWKIDTLKLAYEFIQLGFKAIIVCVDEKHLDKSFVGREFDKSFLNDLPEKVDPCGEYGEFHSFVYDGPIFKKPVLFRKGKIVHRIYTPLSEMRNNKEDSIYKVANSFQSATSFWYCDLLPK
jgi:uncharacterized protein (TIGR00290 family)